MAEGSPIAEAATITDPSLGEHDQTENTTAGAAAIEESADVADNALQPGLTSTRARSSKVANLRAAFEQSANTASVTPRSVSVASTNRNGTSDAEVARLKEALSKAEEALAKEQELLVSEKEARAEDRQAREADRQHIQELQSQRDAEHAQFAKLKEAHEDDQARIEELQRARDEDQARIEALQTAKEIDERSIFRLEEQREANQHRAEQMRVQIAELQDELKGQQEATPRHIEDIQSEHTDAIQLAQDLHLAKGQVQAYEDDVAALRSQLNDMKRSIATNTRIESHEVTDSAFQGELGTICYLVQDWTVSTYRKAKIERSAEEMSTALDTLDSDLAKILRPLFETWDVSSKLAILQSVAVAMMLPIFKNPLPFGLPPASTLSRAVKEASDELRELLEPPAFNRWRATTFDVICHTKAISPFVHTAADRVAQDILETLQQVCGLETADTQADVLRNILRRVIALSHSLRVQRASYEVGLPLPGSAFDAETMEGLSGDHDDTSDCTIVCAMFPVIYKLATSGDRAVLFKARVSWKESWD